MADDHTGWDEFRAHVAARALSPDLEFIRRHGDGMGHLLRVGNEVESTGTPATLEAMRAHGGITSREFAFLKIADVLGSARFVPEVEGNPDVAELCASLRLCLLYIHRTPEDARDAFRDLFCGANSSIVNRERARGRHASKKAVLAECWEHFKKSKYASLAEGARACANHFKRPGAPTERAFLDHFRAQAAAEGLTFKPGRKSATKPKENPA